MLQCLLRSSVRFVSSAALFSLVSCKSKNREHCVLYIRKKLTILEPRTRRAYLWQQGNYERVKARGRDQEATVHKMDDSIPGTSATDPTVIQMSTDQLQLIADVQAQVTLQVGTAS